MVKICCIKTCRSESIGGCGISFHRFPKNPEMHKKWLEVVPGRITASSVVCALHFKPEDFAISQLSSKKYLNPDAVPSIFNAIRPHRQVHSTNAVSNAAGVVDIVENNKINFESDDCQESDYDSDNYDNRNCDNNVNEQHNDDDLCVQETKLIKAKCKCCLGSSKLKSMWREHCSGELPEYGAMLIQCFALPWSRPEEPKSNMEHICEFCIQRLKDAFNFKMEVLASERLLNGHMEDENIGKSYEELDDEDVEFDVTTEYLDYEYLDDNLDDDGALDECNKFNDNGDNTNIIYDSSLVNFKDCIDYRRSQPIGTFRKRKHSGNVLESVTVDAVADRGISPAMKSFKGSNKDVFNNTKVNNELYKTQFKEIIANKKTIGYLEDVLRYSNATPIGGVTPDGFKCCYCRDRYDSPGNLKHHTLDKHAERVTVHTADNHIKLDITDFKCLDCYAKVDSLHGFVQHMQIEHRMRMRMSMHYPVVPFKFDSDVLKCALCDKRFECFDSLDKHMKMHIDDYGRFDAQQSVRLEENNGSNNHYRYSKSSEDLINVQEKLDVLDVSKFERNKGEWNKLKCLSCGWDFENRTALLVHMNKYHLKLLEKCQYCDSKFLEMKDLARHIAVKHSAKTP